MNPNTPKLPFYVTVSILVVFNVLNFVLHYVIGTAAVVVNAVLVALTTFCFEYGISTSLANARYESVQ